MYPTLNPATAGGGKSLAEFCALAHNAGFKGVEFGIGEVVQTIREKSVDAAKEIFESNDVKPGVFGLPVDWRGEEANWHAGLEALPEMAEAAAAIGCFRTCTWIMPRSEVPYEENWKFHVARLKPVGEILSDHGIAMGIEFVGPKTMRTGPHDFMYTLDEALKLAEETHGKGLLLDSFHWFTTHLTIEDILKLKPEQVVHVHINDAPDKDPDEQIDSIRLLPGEGIIDLVGFLQSLKKIGYDGPVAVETFDENLRKMPAEEAASKAFNTLNEVWKKAGI